MLSFTPREPVSLLRASEVIARCLASEVEGVTFLGGEPFAQAQGLSVVARAVKRAGRTVMVFSGYTLDELRAMESPHVGELLAHTDLLVAGRYEASQRTTARRWVGSDNQVMHFLTDRYSPLDGRFHEGNHVELRLQGDTLTLNGWPINGARTRLGASR